MLLIKHTAALLTWSETARSYSAWSPRHSSLGFSSISGFCSLVPPLLPGNQIILEYSTKNIGFHMEPRQDPLQTLLVFRPTPATPWSQADLGLWSQLYHLLAMWSMQVTSKKLLLYQKKKKWEEEQSDGLAMRMKMTGIKQLPQHLDN